MKISKFRAIAAVLTTSGALALTGCQTALPYAIAATSAGFALPAEPVEAAQVTSPDGTLVFALTTPGGQPSYSVTENGETIVGASKLGIRFAEGASLDEGFVLASTEATNQDTQWEQPWGERRMVVDRHNELLARFVAADGSGQGYDLRIRVFDEGFGFRYEVPDTGARVITDEITEFAIDGDATAWWTPAGEFNRLEYTYKTTPVHEIPRANTPLTLRTDDGTHITIHEAALVDYAGMWLDQRRGGMLEADLAPRADGSKVHVDGAFTTPWRVVQVAESAADLYNGSDIYLNLNEPNKLGDVSYFTPGKYVGIWWGMHINTYTWGSGPNHGATTENTMKYIDFAAEHGFNGVLVEGWNIGWDGDWFHNGDLFSFTESYPDYDFEALAAYAANKGTALIGHHETSGNITNYETQLDDALDLMAARGVNTIKTGYVADGSDLKYLDEDGNPQYTWHDSQERVEHDIRVLEAAHARGIAINAHEPARATGLRRTYPNAVSREGARGMEFNAWGTPPNTVEHQAVLPYTRMLAGPFDFTPGIFDLMPNGPDDVNRVPSTLNKQLALYVTIYSPVQMAADLPENYLRYPDAFQFIKDVPADWEHSIALQGEVGDHFVIARKDRGSEDWYLGGVTDEMARTVSVPLDFLSEGVTYTAQIYRDGPGADWKTNPYAYTITTQTVDAGSTLTLPMAPGGGFAVRFAPEETEEAFRAPQFLPVPARDFGPLSRGSKELSGGTLHTWDTFKSSENILDRDVYIWTPPGYDPEGTARYPVIYMHDGQHLFQPGAGVTGEEWKVDETMRQLAYRELVAPAIIVGIASSGERWQDYAPTPFISGLPEDERTAMTESAGGAPQSDAYLDFLVGELKPMVDGAFRTKSDQENTYVAGASMGGLISLYAISRHPDVFGGAAGFSTHWPLWNPETADENAVLAAITTALESGGLDPSVHRIWLDSGTENLDSYYGPYNAAMKSYFEGKGFTGARFSFDTIDGGDHNEASWAERFPDAALFLLGMD